MNMTGSQKELLREIEITREKMHELSYKMNRTSTEVVKVSTRLDELLNHYQLMHIENKNYQVK